MGWGYLSAEKADVKDTRLVKLLIVNPITSRLLKARKAARDRPRHSFERATSKINAAVANSRLTLRNRLCYNCAIEERPHSQECECNYMVNNMLDIKINVGGGERTQSK